MPPNEVIAGCSGKYTNLVEAACIWRVCVTVLFN